MDDRGYGASGGSFASSTSRDFGDDIRAAIAYLKTRSDVDPKQIFLAGHSEGGLIAPMVALDEPSLAGIVLMAGPARSGREILNFQMRYGIEHDTTMAAPKRDSLLARVPAQVDSMLTSAPWLKFFGSYDPLATARRVKTPVLILQGGDDQQVIATEATTLEAAFKAAGNRDVTKRVFPELNHLFIHQPGGNPSGYLTLSSNLAVPEAIGTLAEWVRTHAAVMR
jgi:dipeptidyl aminopeptidase/acylaminoacyl peptidase